MIHIGIDLGTSRSVVCASNGHHKWVESYVGWPKDFVAKKMLGKAVLFGSEALEHWLALNISRPLQNGVIKEGTERDEAAVHELIGHLIDLADVGPDNEICLAVGVPAEAIKVNKIVIKNAISEHARKLMAVSEPFSVACGLGTLDNARKSMASSATRNAASRSRPLSTASLPSSISRKKCARPARPHAGDRRDGDRSCCRLRSRVPGERAQAY